MWNLKALTLLVWSTRARSWFPPLAAIRSLSPDSLFYNIDMHFAWFHATLDSVLTCAGVWMIATLSKVTIPSTPGRLSTFHPSWDLSVVWQSTRVWWGSMLGELASTKLGMQMIAIGRSQRKIDFNNTSSEPQCCLELLHLDKLARLAQLESGRPHHCHGWTPWVCCGSLEGSS